MLLLTADTDREDCCGVVLSNLGSIDDSGLLRNICLRSVPKGYSKYSPRTGDDP